VGTYVNIVCHMNKKHSESWKPCGCPVPPVPLSKKVLCESVTFSPFYVAISDNSVALSQEIAENLGIG